MKKKNKKTVVFPTNQKTEFARFTDPDDFTFDPDAPGTDLRDETFFGENAAEPDSGNDSMF